MLPTNLFLMSSFLALAAVVKGDLSNSTSDYTSPASTSNSASTLALLPDFSISILAVTTEDPIITPTSTPSNSFPATSSSPTLATTWSNETTNSTEPSTNYTMSLSTQNTTSTSTSVTQAFVNSTMTSQPSTLAIPTRIIYATGTPPSTPSQSTFTSVFVVTPTRTSVVAAQTPSTTVAVSHARARSVGAVKLLMLAGIISGGFLI